jgi:HAD superfamily hydrolase (TIGR01509 family)
MLLQRPGTGMIEAVIFDMDGVLVDSEPLHQESTRQVLAECGVVDCVDDPAFVGRTDVEIFTIFRARHRLDPDPATLSRRFSAVACAILREHARPLPGVPDVLHALRAAGYRLALASSSTPEVIAATLEALGIRALFEHVVSAADSGRGKPAPDVFLEAAKRLGVAPSACLVIEDSRNGILAAQAAGMRRIAIPCPTTRAHDFTEADCVLGSLRELLTSSTLDRTP